jgi:hypothetical protein
MNVNLQNLMLIITLMFCLGYASQSGDSLIQVKIKSEDSFSALYSKSLFLMVKSKCYKNISSQFSKSVSGEDALFQA